MLAEDATLPDLPRPQGFRGTTLARMCRTDAEVDAVMAHALSIGARLLKPAHHTSFGGYSGYFADPDGHRVGLSAYPRKQLIAPEPPTR